MARSPRRRYRRRPTPVSLVNLVEFAAAHADEPWSARCECICGCVRVTLEYLCPTCQVLAQAGFSHERRPSALAVVSAFWSIPVFTDAELEAPQVEELHL